MFFQRRSVHKQIWSRCIHPVHLNEGKRGKLFKTGKLLTSNDDKELSLVTTEATGSCNFGTILQFLHHITRKWGGFMSRTSPISRDGSALTILLNPNATKNAGMYTRLVRCSIISAVTSIRNKRKGRSVFGHQTAGSSIFLFLGQSLSFIFINSLTDPRLNKKQWQRRNQAMTNTFDLYSNRSIKQGPKACIHQNTVHNLESNLCTINNTDPES